MNLLQAVFKICFCLLQKLSMINFFKPKQKTPPPSAVHFGKMSVVHGAVQLGLAGYGCLSF